MRYFRLNENNEIIGAYPSKYKNMPKDVIDVNESIWKQRLNDSSLNCYENGKLLKKDFRTHEEIAQQELQAKLDEALKYLWDTDFYYPRYLETGEPVPTDIVIKRQEYRKFLRENENVR